MKSLMDMLIIAQGCGMYVHNKNYKRIGAEVVDKYDLFEESDEEAITNIDNLVVSESKLNVSIITAIKGKVRINPIQADKVGIESEIESIKFRTHSIIRNGKANTDKLVLLIQKDAMDNFKDFKEYIEIINVMEVYNDKTYVRIAIDTQGIPVVTEDNTPTKTLLDLSIKRNKLVAESKVLKYCLDKIEYMSDPEDTYMGGKYTAEQMEILQEHGLDSEGIYKGVKLEQVVDEERFYIAKNIVFQVKGQSSIPSVNAVLKKVDESKRLNEMDTYIYSKLQEYKALEPVGLNPKELEEIKESVDQQLNIIKLKLALVRMSKVINNIEQFDGTDLDKKGNLIYTDGENTLVIKIDNKKVYY